MELLDNIEYCKFHSLIGSNSKDVINSLEFAVEITNGSKTEIIDINSNFNFGQVVDLSKDTDLNNIKVEYNLEKLKELDFSRSSDDVGENIIRSLVNNSRVY